MVIPDWPGGRLHSSMDVLPVSSRGVSRLRVQAISEHDAHAAEMVHPAEFRVFGRSMHNDRVLLRKASQGCKDSLRRIYETHRDHLLTVARALTGNRGTAEDVVHDVFVAFARELFVTADAEGLLQLLDTGLDQTKIAVAKYLGQMGQESAIPALQKLADQWQGPVAASVRPVAGAQVFWGQPVFIYGGRADVTYNLVCTTTDDEGHFAFQAPHGQDPFLAVCDQGIGSASYEELAQNGFIMLRAWARVEGEWHIGNRLAAHRELHLLPWHDEALPHVNLDRAKAVTDENGRFVFEKVYPGRVVLLTFFQSNCIDRYPQGLEELKTVYRRFHQEVRYAQVGLLFGENPLLDKKAIDEAGLNWPTVCWMDMATRRPGNTTCRPRCCGMS